MYREHLLPFLMLFSGQLNAQFSLEHTYAGHGPGTMLYTEVYVVHFETLGDRFVQVDKVDRAIRVMDIAHQIVQTIDLSGVPDASTEEGGRDVLYLSQHLFDLDDGIEFLYVTQSSPPLTIITSVINDDGSVIQSWNDEGPFVNPNSPQEQLPIFNTDSGTKLILANRIAGAMNVYALPGELHVGITGSGNHDLISAPVHVYPNPTASEIVVDLPWSSAGKGSVLEILKVDGVVVLHRSLSSGIERISLAPLSAGEYVYHVLLDGQMVNSGKLTKL